MYDIIIIFSLLFSLAIGFNLGLVRQIINVLGLYFGLVFASYYHLFIIQWVRGQFGQAESFGRETFIFFLIWGMIWGFINLGAHFSFRNQKPRFLPAIVDKLSGMILGILIGLVFVIILTLLLGYGTSIEWAESDGLRILIADAIQKGILPRLLVGRYLPFLVTIIEPWLPTGLPVFFTYNNF
jgi:uncharacterized membrane protein required for colicin V production